MGEYAEMAMDMEMGFCDDAGIPYYLPTPKPKRKKAKRKQKAQHVPPSFQPSGEG